MDNFSDLQVDPIGSGGGEGDCIFAEDSPLYSQVTTRDEHMNLPYVNVDMCPHLYQHMLHTMFLCRVDTCPHVYQHMLHTMFSCTVFSLAI